MNKVKTIVRKEWAEVFKNRMVLFTIIFLPLVFAILPLIMLGIGGFTPLDGFMGEADWKGVC